MGLVWYMKLWPRVLMICSLYLQHSYFLGASRLIKICKDLVTTLRERNDKMQNTHLLGNRETALFHESPSNGDHGMFTENRGKEERLDTLATSTASTPTVSTVSSD